MPMKVEINEGLVKIDLTEKDNGTSTNVQAIKQQDVSQECRDDPCLKSQIRAKKGTIDYNALNEIMSLTGMRIKSICGKKLPAIQHNFNQRELAQYRKNMNEHKRMADIERARVRERNARGRLQDVTQS